MVIHLRLQAGLLIVPLQVTPKGSRNEILPFRNGDAWVRVKVTAPPEDGAANSAVLSLVAKQLQLPTSQLSLMRGHRGRQKQLGIPCQGSETLNHLKTRLAQVLQSEVSLCFNEELAV